MLKKLVKKLSKNKKGFTLIELIVVIAILAILAAILVPVVGNFVNQAHSTAAAADARSVFTAAETYAQNSGAPLAASTNVYVGGTTATDTKIDDTQLTTYLGGTTTWPFSITAITTDTTGNVASVEIKETNTGLYYTFNGTSSIASSKNP